MLDKQPVARFAPLFPHPVFSSNSHSSTSLSLAQTLHFRIFFIMRTNLLACVLIGASVVAPTTAAPVVTKQPVTDCGSFLPNFPASFISCSTADSGRSHKFEKKELAQYQKRQLDIGSLLQGGLQLFGSLLGDGSNGGQSPDLSGLSDILGGLGGLFGKRSMAPPKPSNATKAPSSDDDLSDADIDELVNSILGPLLGGSNSTISPGDDAALASLIDTIFQPIIELLGGLGDSNGTVSADVRRRAGEAPSLEHFLELLRPVIHPAKRTWAPAKPSNGTASHSANADISDKDIEDLINSILQPILEAFSGLGDIFGADSTATVAGKNATVSVAPAKHTTSTAAPAKSATSTPPQMMHHRRFSIDLD
ncbi:hypothetical protein DL96DRAFT_1821781 [Flagelloscypha sp. PMI_526]|nr:hypothetical protein DL96DRAFT_1821781 [Flagelloscypha sp. PMI_526]